ncbi:MAG: NarK family nitrate/nitrite MFS transporter [Ancalomicrobiaceae bacterium]|nr:NarK family nitrate/nitrite MFS transporter [Ancalomicrobiaceae bacterium]
MKILHLSWLAFFLSFLVWFNHAPLMASIRTTFSLSDAQVSAILVLNVALTIPARVVIGAVVDRFGPRVTYSALLAISGVLCLFFACAQDFATLALARFLLGFVGAGFVVGIRMIGEWFPARQMGTAQGIYGGFGNFGSAAAALTMPWLLTLIGGPDGWRWSIAVTGLLAIAYAVVYYLSVSDTPKGATYFKPKRAAAMEVSSRGDFVLLVLMQLPMYVALGLMTWQLGPAKLKLLGEGTVLLIFAGLAGLFLYQVFLSWRVNAKVFTEIVPEFERFRFAQVAVLCLMYMVTFGGELAVVSMLPLFFKDTFGLTLAGAGLVAGVFGGTNFFARPMGGWLGDKIGRRPVLIMVLVGVAVGYLAMSTMSAGSSLMLAIAATVGCSMFVNAANGAVYGVIPIIKRRLTGQIAGLAGAFGNVGGVVYLTLLSSSSPQIFFLAIGGSALVVLGGILLFFREPKGTIAELMPDGSLKLIEVA